MPRTLDWRAVGRYYEKRDAHGTGACYAHGCRCAECRAYSTARRRIYRAKAKGLTIEPTPIQPTIEPRWVDDFPIHKYHDAPWLEQALCKGAPTVIFYPNVGRGHNEHYDEARRLCAACPVADECLTYAISKKERHGLWGGLTERQRRRVERLDIEAALEVGRTIRRRYTPISD